MSTSKAKLKTKTPTHRPGSRKQAVHQTFSRKGKAAALKLGLRRKLKESTLRTWFSTWSPAT